MMRSHFRGKGGALWMILSSSDSTHLENGIVRKTGLKAKSRTTKTRVIREQVPLGQFFRQF
jgi:hypothetical protein